MELYTKVFILSKITREDNFPYYETGKGPRASSDTKLQQWYLHVVQVWFNDASRSALVKYDDVGDSAAWTGLHLAALTHEYNVTKNSTVLVCVDWMELNINTNVRLWLQKDIDNSLDAIVLLTTCSGKPGYIVGHIQPL